MSIARSLVSTLAVLALAFLPAPAGSAGEPTAEGYWTGTIGVGDGKSLEIMIDVARKDASWVARFYAPTQGVHGVELTGVDIAGRSVRFRIPQAEGDPTFRGELAKDGLSLTGSFDDAGQTLPFRLTRAERPAGLDVDIYTEYRNPGTAGSGLAGKWRGLLMTGPNRMRLLLDVRSGESDQSGPTGESGHCGGLTGSVTSLDQGGKVLPVDTFRLEGDSVQFEMLDIGAIYKGTMKPDGSEFFGVWIQQGTEFPLTFRRLKDTPKPPS